MLLFDWVVEWRVVDRLTQGCERGSAWRKRSERLGFLDGQLESDVHLSFLCKGDDFRKLYNLWTEQSGLMK